MNGEEEKALHNIMKISAVIFIVMTMLLFGVLASPSLSPVAAIGDWDGDGHRNGDDLFPRDKGEWADADGDGVGDNGDAFPDDPDESSDLDGDGIGDNEDFFDEGDGTLRISLDSFEFIGYEGTLRTRYYPNPWFQVFVDIDDDGIFDTVFNSTIFNETRSLSDFFSITVDIDDRVSFAKFTVIVYDVMYVSNNNVTEYEIMDYSPVSGVKTVEHVIGLPCDLSWQSDGRNDVDTPDCYLAYSATTIVSP